MIIRGAADRLRCLGATRCDSAKPYLRSLLVLGARTVLVAAKVSRWAIALAQRRGYRKAGVAIAAKNARLWRAVLSRGEGFRLPALTSPSARQNKCQRD